MKYESFHYWILDNLETGKTILEFGSGPGTILLSKKFNMNSIEHNSKWVNHCKDSNYIYAPIKEGWYDVHILTTELPKLTYDLILVDGPTGDIGRSKLIDNLHLLNTDVIIVFDDVNRPAELNLMKNIANKLHREYEIFHGNNRHFAILK
jgi:hypothetical protein